MPIDTEHRQYNERVGHWNMCRDCASGEDQVKDKTTSYLPMLSGQDGNEYEAYKKRADFYGAFGRTIQGVGGAVFRRLPTVELPTHYEDYADDVTLTDVPFSVFARNVFDEVMTVGRVGVYADMPAEGSADLPMRPYAVMVTAENIINWQSVWSRQFGRYVLNRVVIKESVDAPVDDYATEEILQYRELTLVDGVYNVVIWREAKEIANGDKWVEHDRVIPQRLGQPLGRIPFQFLNVTTLNPDTQKPPLLDLAHANLSHYRTSADLEHGRHYTALPTPWVAGFPRDTELRIGANIAWVSDDPSAKAGILEFTGQGLGALENAIDQKEKRMAILGARMLEAQPAHVEAAETVRLRQAGEAATVQGIVNASEAALRRLMGWLVYWGGGDHDDATVELNRDVIDTNATPQEITAWTQALQSGAISFDTYYYLLKRSDMTRPDVDAETEKEQIENDGGEVAVAEGRGETTDDDDAEIAEAVASVG